ncbi:uncharacterized protein LOC119689439 [Teleopsis dalmanni]|uniref:uncharacterized protein LOC119689436 n=1 Tax=Teleopsis dalmanni TaxID=139649 RepID=UPI0018CF2CCC|nr:uncharacterized protein LOC119689436 [Teleopsis dalmanni]XP_037960198.1 uncharacterized protein LOC119689439 [Teleopsis dalmanni]
MENTLRDDGMQLSVSSDLAAIRTAKQNIHQRLTLAYKFLEVHSNLNRDINKISQLDEYECRNRQDTGQHVHKIRDTDCDSSLDSTGPIIKGNFSCRKHCRRRAKHKLKRTHEYMKQDISPNSFSCKEVSSITIKNDLTTVYYMPSPNIEDKMFDLTIQDDKTVELFENEYQNRSDVFNAETNNLTIEPLCTTHYQCDAINEESEIPLVEACIDVSFSHHQLLQSDKVVAQPVPHKGKQVSKKSILKLCGSVSSADSNIIKRYPAFILSGKNNNKQKARKPESFVPVANHTDNRDKKYLSQKTLLQYLNECEQNLEGINSNNVNSTDAVSAASHHEAIKIVEGAEDPGGVEDVEDVDDAGVDSEHKCLELFSLVRSENLLEEFDVSTDEEELLKGPINHLFNKEVSRLLTIRDSEFKNDETVFYNQVDNALQIDITEVIEFERESPLLISSTNLKKFESKETQTSARCTCGYNTGTGIIRTESKRRTHRCIYLDLHWEDC